MDPDLRCHCSCKVSWKAEEVLHEAEEEDRSRQGNSCFCSQAGEDNLPYAEGEQALRGKR